MNSIHFLPGGPYFPNSHRVLGPLDCGNRDESLLCNAQNDLSLRCAILYITFSHGTANLMRFNFFSSQICSSYKSNLPSYHESVYMCYM